MLVSQQTISQLEAFNKYAKFISDHFGVNVILDGTKACTDGKTIYLPSLATMNKDEIEFLYCVLLHEVGHVRHSLFTPESFAPIKTKGHFYICNALEDARIENKLMAEFDGAHKIFHSLYNEFASDENFMHRIFGIKNENMTLWDAIGVYCHDYYVELSSKKPLDEIMPPKLAKQLEKFVFDHDLEKLLSKTPLNSWDDVLKLGTKIYNLYFSIYNDRSEKVSITPLVKTMESVKDQDIVEMENMVETLTKKMQDIHTQMKPIQERIAKKREERKEKVDELYNQQEQLENVLDKLETVHDNQKILTSKEEKITKLENQIQEMVNRLNDYENKKEALKKNIEEQTKKELAKLDKSLQAEAVEGEVPQPAQLTKDLMSQKLQDMHDKLSRLEERINNTQDKIKEKTPKIDENKKITEEAKQELEKVNPELKTLSQEELDKLISSHDQERRKVNDELRKLTSAGEDEEKLRALRNELNKTKEQVAQQMTSLLEDMQQKLDEAGIPVNLIPKFEENPAWEEADEVQQAFDQEASNQSGDLVTNGCGFGLQSPRDIITYIDKVKNDVASFDIGEHFYESNHESKLESFNEETSQLTNTRDVKDGKISKSIRKHIPLSVMFDKVVTKTHSDGKEIYEIRVRLAPVISQIKNIFRNHLKFTKKDHFKGNQEEGKLDSRNLWKLATKTDDLYYEVNKPKFVNKVSAAIALDVSGSMDKGFTEHGERLKELAYLLSEGLKEVHIQHEILGYHAPVNHELRALGASPLYNRNSNNLETVVYKNFTDRSNLGIQNINIECSDNSDGESIKLVAKRLLKSRSKRKVLFVITDGKPFLSDADVEILDQDLKNTIEWCKFNKIELFAFGFNEQGREFYGDRFCFISNYNDLIKFIKEKL